MFKLPDLDISVREGPVTVATTLAGPHVPCPSEAEEFLNRILPDPLGIRRDIIRLFVKPHVDALDELVHLVTENRSRFTLAFTRRSPMTSVRLTPTSNADKVRGSLWRDGR